MDLRNIPNVCSTLMDQAARMPSPDLSWARKFGVAAQNERTSQTVRHHQLCPECQLQHVVSYNKAKKATDQQGNIAFEKV
jgi:hypothetical protein